MVGSALAASKLLRELVEDGQDTKRATVPQLPSSCWKAQTGSWMRSKSKTRQLRTKAILLVPIPGETRRCSVKEALDADRICRFKMPDGSMRRMHAKELSPTFFAELISDEKLLSKGAETLRDCVAADRSLEGLLRLQAMCLEEE